MKKVAGPLKLLYSQYKELAAFAQFGSDLDEDTKKRLAQGERIVEVLKQGEHQPLAVENQVMMIHAVTNDLLAEIPVNNIARFEKELYEFVNTNYPEIGKKILENGDFTQELTNAINEFKKKFVIEA
ncbi:ATP synthase subunit alpha [bioreactor metagenome]